MDFAPTPASQDACDRMWDFMRERVFPAEAVWAAELARDGEHSHPPVMEELKREARERGLWNLFLPSQSGLSNVDYAAVAEITGWSPVLAPEAINCQAPDTGNMETLHLFGTDEQVQGLHVAGVGRLAVDRLGRDHRRPARHLRDGGVVQVGQP